MSYDLTQHYGLFLKRFTRQAADLTGPVPSVENLKVAFAFSQRSQKQALSLAMRLRPEGATQGEIIYIMGKPQNNWVMGRGGLVEAGYFKRIAVPQRDGISVAKLELTAKGRAFVDKASAKQAAGEAAGAAEAETPAKPVKKAKPVKGPAKAKGKAKAKPATTLAADAVEPASGPGSPVEGPLADDGATVDAVVTETSLEPAE